MDYHHFTCTISWAIILTCLNLIYKKVNLNICFFSQHYLAMALHQPMEVMLSQVLRHLHGHRLQHQKWARWQVQKDLLYQPTPLAPLPPDSLQAVLIQLFLPEFRLSTLDLCPQGELSCPSNRREIEYVTNKCPQRKSLLSHSGQYPIINKLSVIT